MTHPGSRVARYLMIGAFGAAALTGCSGADDDLVPNNDSVTAVPTPSQTRPDDVSPAAATQLCDMIGTEIDNWRGQGPVLAKVSFNGTVQNWATRNDAINADVVRDKSLIDSVTTRTCPEVRGRALEVLGTDELSDALVGFGG
ncbi:hypothetical protein ACTD5D_28365 [Nocardia takedensis]|uniref:hypothetical protein n=1 Tax=Nocardia takedensis TaxID=259390 RepID=UPI00031F0553|nr:hypothetical protein [Nocardia takedensis]